MISLVSHCLMRITLPLSDASACVCFSKWKGKGLHFPRLWLKSVDGRSGDSVAIHRCPGNPMRVMKRHCGASHPWLCSLHSTPRFHDLLPGGKQVGNRWQGGKGPSGMAVPRQPTLQSEMPAGKVGCERYVSSNPSLSRPLTDEDQSVANLT